MGNTLQNQLIRSEHLAEKDKAIGQKVVISTQERVFNGLIDTVVGGNKITWKEIQVPAIIIGGTKNTYQVITKTSLMPWVKPHIVEITKTTYAVKMADNNVKLVPEEELAFVYDDSIWLSESKPSSDEKPVAKPASKKVKVAEKK
jgi:hypothetical protein